MTLPLDPKSDVVFKALFGHASRQDLLLSLLESVLRPTQPILSIELLDPNLPKIELTDRGLILDLRAKLDDGRLVDVEMQMARHGGLRERVLAYWARLFTTQLTPGDFYKKVHPCLSILFLGESLLHGTRPYSTFQVLEVTDHQQWSDAFELHVIELPKTTLNRHDPLSRWARFFQTEDDHELEELIRMDRNIAKAVETIEQLSSDPEVREVLRLRELARMNWSHSHACAIEEGRELGLKLGREEGREEGRKHERRAAVQTLCQVLGIPLEADRASELSRMGGEQLSALIEHLKNERCWPGG